MVSKSRKLFRAGRVFSLPILESVVMDNPCPFNFNGE